MTAEILKVIEFNYSDLSSTYSQGFHFTTATDGTALPSLILFQTFSSNSILEPKVWTGDVIKCY